MAIASWCTISPLNGANDATLSVSGQLFSGNVNRSTSATIQNQSGNKPSATLTIVQTAAMPIYTFTQSQGKEYTAEANAINIPFEFTTNLDWTRDDLCLGIEFPYTHSSVNPLQMWINYFRNNDAVIYINDLFGRSGNGVGAFQLTQANSSKVVLENTRIGIPLSLFEHQSTTPSTNRMNLYSTASGTNSLDFFNWNHDSKSPQILKVSFDTYSGNTMGLISGTIGYCTIGSASSISLSPSTATIPAIGTEVKVEVTSNDSWVVS